MLKEASDGTMIDVLPEGTKVRHKEHTELTGKIMRHEYHESGKISPLPYLVYWDNPEAWRVLGILSLYPRMDEVEPV